MEGINHTPMKHRVTPDWITELLDNEVFVFGSNLKGLHGDRMAFVFVAFMNRICQRIAPLAD